MSADATDDGEEMLCKVYEDGYTVRRMTKADAHIIIDWYSGICATSVDLNIALEEYGLETQAFVGLLDGKIIASCVRTPVAERTFYGSLFYVEEKHRMGGYGRRIRDEVAGKFLGDQVLCIDAHEELMPMNKRRGYTEAFEVVHYTGKAAALEVKTQDTDIEIVPLTSALFEELIGYDNKCFVKASSPYRRKLLERWTSISGGDTILAVRTIAEKKEIVGFGIRRPAMATGNHIIGPLYAEGYDVAWSLVATLTKDISHQNIWMTICVPNHESGRLVQELGLTENIHMRRMYLNGVLPSPSERVFAITSIDICGF